MFLEGTQTVTIIACMAVWTLAIAVAAIGAPQAWARSGRSRLAERELRQRGINLFWTPTDPGTHTFYEWMRAGREVYDKIAPLFPRYQAGSRNMPAPVEGTAIEVFPRATAVLLRGDLCPRQMGKVKFPARSLRGNEST